MFTITEEHILGLLIVSLVFLSIRIFKNILKNYKIIKLKREIIENGKKKVAEMKAAGEYHEWIDVFLGDEERNVCKKTGYCPSLDGFIPMQYIEMHLQKLKLEEEYQEFRLGKINEIAEEMNLTNEEVEKFADRIYSIKKDFHILKLTKLAEGLKSNESGN